MLDLGHVFQFVVDGLDQRSLAKKNLVSNSHDLSLHVALQLCDQLNAVHKEPGKEILADISLVTDQFSEDLRDEGFVLERLPVIGIAGREHEVQQISLLVADQVQFETVEPAHRALSPLGDPPEHLVEMNALVPADAQRGAVHETDARADAHAAPLHEQDERNGDFPFQLDETIIGDRTGKQVTHVLAYFIQIKVLQAFVSTQVKQYHDRYHFGIGQRAIPMVFPSGFVPRRRQAVDLDKSFINFAEIIRHTEYFRNFVFSDRHSESLCIWLFTIPNLQKLSLFS